MIQFEPRQIVARTRQCTRVLVSRYDALDAALIACAHAVDIAAEHAAAVLHVLDVAARAGFEGLEPWIREEQTFRGVHDRDAFHHAAENRGREIALFGERADGTVEACGRLIQGHRQSFQCVAGAVCINGTKIAFGNAARKRSQTVHPIREGA